MTALHFVAPDGVEDPGRPSGGNTYDRLLCRELRALGWSVHEHPVPGPWPQPEPASLARLDQLIKRIPDDAPVLLDGLVASAAPEVLVPQARRLRSFVLVHMPLGHRPPDDRETRERERAVLWSAAGIVTTSAWARRRLLELYALPSGDVHVAEPAVDAAQLAPGTPAGGELLCVATVTFDKGHDVLLDALQTVSDQSWHCLCVGSLERDPMFAQEVRRRSVDSGLAGRVEFLGPLTGAELERVYAAADVLVLASRAETYGMVITEALARGLPVIASEVGGLTEAVGHGADRIRPGLLVPPEDAGAIGAALRVWLGDAELRARLRRAARERRGSLAGWSTTASALAGVLTGSPR